MLESNHAIYAQRLVWRFEQDLPLIESHEC